EILYDGQARSAVEYRAGEVMPRVLSVQRLGKPQKCRVRHLRMLCEFLDDRPYRPRTEPIIAPAPVTTRDEHSTPVVAGSTCLDVFTDGQRAYRMNPGRNPGLRSWMSSRAPGESTRCLPQTG